MNKNVFISYTHSEEIKPVAREIATKLKNMGLKVWFDENEMQIGSSIKDSIKSGLDSSSYVIALVSPNEKNNEWHKKELELAKSKGKFILPVMVNNAKFTDLPDIISDLFAINISDNKENITKIYDAIDIKRSVWSKLKEYIVNE